MNELRDAERRWQVRWPLHVSDAPLHAERVLGPSPAPGGGSTGQLTMAGGDRVHEGGPDDTARRTSRNVNLIFDKLLHEQYDEATALFEGLGRFGRDFELAGHLDEKDYRDCLFLLGEAYEKKGQPERALQFYETVYELERKGPLRYFLDELRERIRAIRGG